jgi:hypothetical protein
MIRLLLCLLLIATASAKEKRISVFVGLCDNATQGIAKVGAKIGDGNVPEENLYWGCTDGFKDVFKKSPRWKLVKDEKDTGDPRIMERMTFHHADKDAVLIAEAWRGAKLSDCLRAAENAAVAGDSDLVAFIGHNVLMDGDIDPPAQMAKGKTDMMVLCCKSDIFFRIRQQEIGLHPALYTADYMYPGSFILHAALDPWLDGKGNDAIRAAAGEAYAKNQKIKVAAATGVFSKIAL